MAPLCRSIRRTVLLQVMAPCPTKGPFIPRATSQALSASGHRREGTRDYQSDDGDYARMPKAAHDQRTCGLAANVRA